MIERKKSKIKNQIHIIFISNNDIGAEGAAKLGEGISNLLNLTTLNLNLGLTFIIYLNINKINTTEINNIACYKKF